jgi:hypothetical protein
MFSPWVEILKDYVFYGTTYYTKAEGGYLTVDAKTNKEGLITLLASM